MPASSANVSLPPASRASASATRRPARSSRSGRSRGLQDLGLLLGESLVERLALDLLQSVSPKWLVARPLGRGVALVEQVVDAALDEGVLLGSWSVSPSLPSAASVLVPVVSRSCSTVAPRTPRSAAEAGADATASGVGRRPGGQGHWPRGTPRHQRHRLLPPRRASAADEVSTCGRRRREGRARRPQRRRQDHAPADRLGRRGAARRLDRRSGGLGVMRQLVGRIDDDRSIRDLLASLATPAVRDAASSSRPPSSR